MQRYKIFILAEHLERRDHKGHPQEKMFSYDMEDDTQETAFARCKAIFDKEEPPKGWRAVATSVMVM